MSASQIKIMEPGAVGVSVNGAPAQPGGEGERLVVITGQPANIIYSRCVPSSSLTQYSVTIG
jgi:hypothetical protein